MNLRTLLLLLVGVAALGTLAWWQSARDREAERAVDAALLEGFDVSRVTALRVDNLERSLQMRIERAADGEWQIVDPVHSPAEPALIEFLFDALSTQTAKSVANDDPKKIALDPPRVVLEIEETVAGAARTRRIEIGAVDLDGQRVYVRTEGRIARTERGLETIFDRDLGEWRSHSLMRFVPRDVVEVHRRGALVTTTALSGIDVAFDAVDDGGWQATAPFQARLDEGAMRGFLLGLSALRVHAFVDEPGPLDKLGLDPPLLTLELQRSNGQKQVLRLAPERAGETWFAVCDDSPVVFRVTNDTVMTVAAPIEALLDIDLVKVKHEEVARVVLAHGDTLTTFKRSGRTWSFDATRAGVPEFTDEPADAEAVEEVLGLIERTRFLQLVPERALRDDELTGALHVEVGGEQQGGALGPLWRSTDGAEGVLFRRDGDLLTALIDKRVLEAVGRAPQTWRNLELHRIPEIEVARIELVQGGVERVYVRNDKGKWCRRDSTAEATEFAKLVDGILSMRASELLKRGFDDKLERELEVRVVRYSGDMTAFTLGDSRAAAHGTPTPSYRTGQRFARVTTDLAETLRGLLAQP